MSQEGVMEMTKACLYRIRLDAEGESAADVEKLFAAYQRELSSLIGGEVFLVRQVIELSEHSANWFKGRCSFAPDLAAQGYNNEEGGFVTLPPQTIDEITEMGQ